MKTRVLFIILASVVVGAAITLVSGLIQTPMIHLGVDVVYWGLPLPWVIRVIPRAPQILWARFIADAAFWTLIAFLALATVMYLGRRRTVDQPTPLATSK